MAFSVSSLFSLLRFSIPICHAAGPNREGLPTLSTVSDPSSSSFHLIPNSREVEEGEILGFMFMKRREFNFMLQLHLAVSGFTLASTVPIPNASAQEYDVPEDFRVYSDDVNKFKILIPREWEVGAGEPNGFKSVTAFFPKDADSLSSSVSVVITGLGADFTRMESFGKVEAFAETLVSGLDRSWRRPPGVTAKLLDCKAVNGFYYIEYTLQNPGERCKHLLSAIGMASKSNGYYNRLYTVTGQFLEEESEKYSSKINKAVASFRFS